MPFYCDSFFSSLIAFHFQATVNLVQYEQKSQKSIHKPKRILHLLGWILFTLPLLLFLLRKVILTTFLQELVCLLIREFGVLMRIKEYVTSMTLALFLLYECNFSTTGLRISLIVFEIEVQ